MKLTLFTTCAVVNVAPYVGAWIETAGKPTKYAKRLVAPYVGAWIETLLSRRRPLLRWVAPYVGAWIETRHIPVKVAVCYSRTLRGCVD